MIMPSACHTDGGRYDSTLTQTPEYASARPQSRISPTRANDFNRRQIDKTMTRSSKQ